MDKTQVEVLVLKVLRAHAALDPDILEATEGTYDLQRSLKDLALAYGPLPQELSAKEIKLGRSPNYYEMSAEEQWADDKRSGLLDWNGR